MSAAPRVSEPDPVPDAPWSSRLDDLVHERYGLRIATAVRLGGEVDQNWMVTTPDSHRFLVKIAPAGTDVATPAWQAELLDDLARRSAPLEFPRTVPALDGSRVVVSAATDRQDAPTTLRVQTWLTGQTLSDLAHHSPDLLRDWGRTAAQLLSALGQTPTRSHVRTHHWDVTRAPAAIARGLPAVTVARHIEQVHVVLRWFADVVAPRLADLPRQLVHHDLNDFNVLARPDEQGQLRVTGVLDFGDALVAPRVAELAVAVAYAMLRKPDPLAAAADVVAGFAESVRLDDAELAVLYPLAAARLCVNAVTWTSREPHSGAYARARMNNTWPAIELLTGLPPVIAEQALRVAAGHHRPAPATFDLAGVSATVHEVRAHHLTSDDVAPVRRTTTAPAPAVVRLGCRVRVPAGSDVRMIEDATVVSADPHAWLVRHDTAGGRIWARWTGLEGVPAPGTDLLAGDTLGRSAHEPCDVALFTDLEAARCAPSSNVVTRAQAAGWAAVSPDPARYLGLPAQVQDASPTRTLDVADLEAGRARHFARSQRHYYDRPMRLTSSSDVWLHDDSGYAYLDVINNVAHVGHANTEVVRAMTAQAGRLNTNSRLLYDGIDRYADRLTALLPDPLEVVFLVCTGSEANDLALRIARQVTGREHVVVIEGAYHGNTSAVTAISPDRYRGPGGAGRPATTHEAMQPNRYRGRWGYDDHEAGRHYAADVTALMDALTAGGTPPAAFIAESLMGTAGTIVHPPGYLAAAFAATREAGALCISDEVQVGFGRLGRTFWGFQTHDVVPDIVTMGKPMGNGHPMAAVVTTRAVADAFDTGMKYFNTFGGNPVSCAIGEAVLDEIAGRELQAAAHRVGAHLRQRLDEIADRHDIVGDVRGDGLYLGIELVVDRDTKAPAARAARRIAERLKDEGVVIYPTGGLDNILKIKPPMTFTTAHADLFAATLDEVLTTGW